MSKKPIVTKETVFAAADALLKSGRYPTQALVRTQLGGGSYSYINQHLKEWKDKQEQEKLLNPSLMPSMPKEVRDAFESVYAAAYNTIEENIVNDRINVLESENEMLRNENDMLSKELKGYEETKGEINLLKEMYSKADTERAEQQKQIGQLGEIIKHLQQQLQQLQQQNKK